MCASLQSAGTEPEDREGLKRAVSAGAISLASSFSTCGRMPSGPQALCGFRFYPSLGDLDVLHGWKVTVMHASLLHEFFFCVPLAIAKD